jgi:hypothetical protein
MSDHDARMLSVMTEMRDLLRLIAEPAIAQRDKKLRSTLRGLAGTASGKKAKAILLMDGTRTQSGIVGTCGIDSSDLSALVKKLKAAELLTGDPKQPQLVISIPANFFELPEGADE